MPDRLYTAFFTAPSSTFTTKDIFDALLTDSVPASAVCCLQRSPNGNVLITFALQKYRDLFLRRCSFIVHRSHYVTHPGSRRFLFVTVYDAMHELLDSALEHRLIRYGQIFSSRRGKVQGYPDFFNGLQHLRMELNTHIPCFLRFGKYQIQVKHDGQPTTCRRCNSRDHLFKDCRNEVCFKCDRAGHHSRLCPEDTRCCICKEGGHLARDCQHSWYQRPPAFNALSPEAASVTPPAPESTPAESAPKPAAVHPLPDQASPEDGSSITLRSTEAATHLATSGFDYGPERKPLKLLGARTIHVSVFVAVEYPDQKIVNFLKQYGQLKSENLCRLCYTEEGFTNIKRGIRVAKFTSLDKDLPRKVVTQGLKIFKYTGKPITCCRCGSTEQVVKNCPKQRSHFSHIRAEDRVLPALPNPTTSQTMQDSQMETTGGEDSADEISEDTPPAENSADDSSLTPDLSPTSASRDLFHSQQSRKHPPSSPGKTHKPEAKERAIDSDQFKTSPTIRGLLRALKQSGSERTKLINTITGPQYYRARAHYLQYKHGNYDDLDLNNAVRRGLIDHEVDAWVQLHRTISQDAFAELVAISEDLGRKHPGLFKN